MSKKVVAQIVLKLSEEVFLEEGDVLHMLMQMISRREVDPRVVFLKVEEIKVFPTVGTGDDTIELVPAAAGEVTAAETIVPLLGKRPLGWAKQAINCRLRRPVEEVVEATISRHPNINTLFAWCLTDTHDWQWVTVPLPPESVDLILG